jgi:hypothetical protein
VYNIGGMLVRVQVKSAWYDAAKENYVVDTRRTKTNRREMVRELYGPQDFDFALAYIDELDVFYVFPVEVFIGYGSEIHLVESEKGERRPRSVGYREAWGVMAVRAGMSPGVSIPVSVCGRVESQIVLMGHRGRTQMRVSGAERRGFGEQFWWARIC